MPPSAGKCHHQPGHTARRNLHANRVNRVHAGPHTRTHNTTSTHVRSKGVTITLPSRLECALLILRVASCCGDLMRFQLCDIYILPTIYVYAVCMTCAHLLSESDLRASSSTYRRFLGRGSLACAFIGTLQQPKPPVAQATVRLRIHRSHHPLPHLPSATIILCP